MISKRKINAYELKKFIKIILLLLAVFISILTLYLSQRLVNKIAVEETKKWKFGRLPNVCCLIQMRKVT